MKRILWLAVIGCGPAIQPAASDAGSTPTVSEPVPEESGWRVHLGAEVDGTRVGPDGIVVIEGEHDARFVPTERLDVPMSPSDAYRGRFVGTELEFRVESPEGDALCPGTPTTITWAGGATTIDAPIVREEGRGVVGMILVAGEQWLLLRWATGWRVVTWEGETLATRAVPPTEDCDCCE